MVVFLNISIKWEDMCGPSGLYVWNDTSKDFGLCFQELFLQIPLFFLLAIISGYYVGYRKDWVIREKALERVIMLRSFIILALAISPIIQLYIFLTRPNTELYPIDYFTAGTSCIAWLVHFGFILALKHRLGPSSRGPLSILLLWSGAVILNLMELRSTILNSNPPAYCIGTLCCHTLYFLTLLPASDSRPTFYSPWLVGSQRSHSEYTPLLPHYDEEVLGTAMQGVNWISKLTFSWVNPLFKKGLENKLNDLEELYDIPATYRCSYVGAKIDRALVGNVDLYQLFVDVPHEPFIGSGGYGAVGETQPQASTPVTPVSRIILCPPRRHNVSLLRALHKCFGLQFYGIGVFKLIFDMAGFAGPILLNKLVKFIEDETIDQHYGYVYASLLLASALIGAFCNCHFNWLMSIIGIKMRGAIVSTILRKTLGVTQTELMSEFSFGEITNFMSTDTDRIVNSCPSFHALWSIPLQLTITLFLLYDQVGISFLAGVAFSIILIPINKVIANKIGKLSTDMMKHKDERVNLMCDLIRGVRTVKAHVWEDYFITKVSGARTQELKYLRGRKYLDAICVVLWATTPVLVAAMTLGTHALRGQPLDAPTVFTTVALINMLIAPLNAFPWVLNGLTEAWVSMKRIQNLLNTEDMNPDRYFEEINKNRDEDKIIILKDVTFLWKNAKKVKKPKKNKGKSKRKVSQPSRVSIGSVEAIQDDASRYFYLENISLEIGRDELIGVAGPVGSGKTSLLLAIMGAMMKTKGEIQVAENLNSFGYVAQQPWLVRGTIRDNILFGKPYDESKFRSVVEACALTEDLNILGWNAYVGEGGCTLSGGQRARIALARAVYQDKKVYLLDDVLSGLDATVAQHIMQKCILGLLKHSTRILVTHSPRHLARMNRVLLLQNGHVHAFGPPETVLNEIEEFLPSETESIGEEPVRSENDQAIVTSLNDDAVSRNSLDNDEVMSVGTVGWGVIWMYLRSVGSFLSLCIVISLILMQVSQNFTFLWLTFWIKSRTNSTTFDMYEHEETSALDHGFNAADQFVHTLLNLSLSAIHNLDNHGTDAAMEPTRAKYSRLLEEPGFLKYTDNYYLIMYFALAGTNLVFTIMRAFFFAYGGVKAAERIHKALLKVVVKANVKFFDVTPTGRIINRFSSDTYTVDDSLPFILNILLAQLFGLIGAIAVTIYGLPWLFVGILPMTLIYYRLQKRYRVTSRQLKRLQSVALSPVYVHFNDTLEGLTSIRGLGATEAWCIRGEELVERWQRAALCGSAAAQWLGLRLQAAAAAALAAAALIAVLQRATHAADPGLVGLAISYALSMTSMLSSVLSSFTETEREMIAVERVGEYIRQVEMEKIDGDPPPYGWPSHGVISFEDVSLNYSERSTQNGALCGVSFSSHPGERLGVVGRTGAGKSSLLRAILRLAPCGSGRVLIDSIDVASLHLHALRSRIGIIPQEPFIFSGTILDNVDPLEQYFEHNIWQALEACGISNFVMNRGGLTSPAENLSRGHKQLLCLTRALLQRAKILLVDEATANLDQETERTILDTIRCSFVGSTVVFVAHRLTGVLECSRVLVLSAGQVVELRDPDDALSDPTSHLYKLVHPDEN
ncbi:ABC transporter C family member 13 [Pieris brassicae]|uniref:ABC transporter C family member 13 n=1 Tax=Pieris brassicae TaxID=7116 RepID=UPI001E661071|nr:ABC transporter C family member 13 [Pieris brassicae]